MWKKLAREGSPTPSTIASSSLRSKDRSPTLYTLAFPSFSTATYMFDVHKAAPVACRVISEFLRAHPDLPIRLVAVRSAQASNSYVIVENYMWLPPFFE
jgi:O-acetyl-ADP-ribose deacetylase (regulator of RNase III)